MSVTFCMMIPFRKKNTLSAYRSQGGGDHLIKRKPASFRHVFNRGADPYFASLRRSVTVRPPTPQLSVSTSSMITVVVAGFLFRVSTSSWVTPSISAFFCSAVAPSRVILILTKGMVFSRFVTDSIESFTVKLARRNFQRTTQTFCALYFPSLATGD